jgi:hypothetical protein
MASMFMIWQRDLNPIQYKILGTTLHYSADYSFLCLNKIKLKFSNPLSLIMSVVLMYLVFFGIFDKLKILGRPVITTIDELPYKPWNEID